MNPLQEYIRATSRRKVKLGDQEIDVLLATTAQLDQFQKEAQDGENAPSSQLSFARRWLSVLVPDFAAMASSDDVPPAIVMELFNEVVKVSFTAKKNG